EPERAGLVLDDLVLDDAEPGLLHCPVRVPGGLGVRCPGDRLRDPQHALAVVAGECAGRPVRTGEHLPRLVRRANDLAFGASAGVGGRAPGTRCYAYPWRGRPRSPCAAGSRRTALHRLAPGVFARPLTSA